MLLFKSVVGSKLHRTDTKDSDTDVRSVYKVSLRERLSPFYSEKVRHERGDKHDSVSYELSHFVRLLAKNNPTAIETVASDLMTGDSGLASHLLSAALDTNLYVKQTNGMIQGMVKKGTNKSLSHAIRLTFHLDYYISTGDLLFNTENYPQGIRDDIMDMKKYGREIPYGINQKRAVKRIHHEQDLDRLEQIVYNQYIDG